VRPPLLISTGKALLYLALAACLFAIIAGRLVPALAIALVTVLAAAIALFLYFFLEIRLRTPAVVRVLERVHFEGPRTARQVLESVRPQLPSMTLVPRSDLLLDAMSHLEEWAGEHGRASKVSRVALWRSPDPPEPRQVGHLVRSTVESLALTGETEEAQRWLAWGQKHCPTEFAGKDWLTCAILRAREGRMQDALASLRREPDPLSTPARAQLVAKAIRSFVTDAPEPLPLNEVRYLGSSWPELAAFLDRVERTTAEATAKGAAS
jgi:hypothetical protein